MTEQINIFELSNKLFCTFTAKDILDDTLYTITTHYSIMYDKIFVLEVVDGEEYLITYNIDPHNSSSSVLKNTILLHRKKESNTLYTINGLNALIRTLNNGTVDPHFKVNWQDHRNTVLLTQGPDLRQLKTKIFKIVTL